MGRSPYQSEKRRKELARLAKQEEKRQKRFAKRHQEQVPGEVTAPQGVPADAAAPADTTPPDSASGAKPGGPDGGTAGEQATG